MVEVCEDYLRNLLEDDEFESSILDGSDISEREFVEVEDATEAIILMKEALALRKVRHVAMPGKVDEEAEVKERGRTREGQGGVA